MCGRSRSGVTPTSQVPLPRPPTLSSRLPSRTPDTGGCPVPCPVSLGVSTCLRRLLPCWYRTETVWVLQTPALDVYETPSCPTVRDYQGVQVHRGVVPPPWSPPESETSSWTPLLSRTVFLRQPWSISSRRRSDPLGVPFSRVLPVRCSPSHSGFGTVRLSHCRVSGVQRSLL